MGNVVLVSHTGQVIEVKETRKLPKETPVLSPLPLPVMCKVPVN